MKPLLLAALALGALAQGCRRPSDTPGACPEPPPPHRDAVADFVKLELLGDNSLTRKGVVQEYQVTNQNRGAIYFVRPESSFSDENLRLALPFYELHEGDELSVYGYIAPLSTDTDNYPYPYTLRRVEPGGTFRGKIEIAAPLKFNPPYPPPFQSYSIDGFWLDRIRLTLGVLPCSNANLKADASGDVRDFSEDTVIACGSSQREAREFQQLITAERGIAWSGCLPDGPGHPSARSCEQEGIKGR